MKKLFALFLALAMFLTACAGAENTAEPEPALVILPFVEQLGAARLQGVEYNEDETLMIVVYENAELVDLNCFLFSAAVLGTYHKPITADEPSDTSAYILIVPGSAYQGLVVYDSVEKLIYIQTDSNIAYPTQDVFQGLLELISAEVKLPEAATGNVFPQFSACVSRQPYFTGTMGEISYAFDGALCWTEIYDEMDLEHINSYSAMMLRFGFSVDIALMSSTEEGITDPCLLRYSNGDAEVLVLYRAAEKNATVHYKPGVSTYLLNAAELTEAIG